MKHTIKYLRTAASGAVLRLSLSWGATTQLALVFARPQSVLSLFGSKHAAAGASRSAVRNAVKSMTKDIARDGKQLHHLNPLFGHPGGAKALFPTGGLPKAIHSHPFNLKLLDRAPHTGAHRWMRRLEKGWSKAVNLPLTTASAGADIFRGWHRKRNMQCPR